jgi:hypothetical protein
MSSGFHITRHDLDRLRELIRAREVGVTSRITVSCNVAAILTGRSAAAIRQAALDGAFGDFVNGRHVHIPIERLARWAEASRVDCLRWIDMLLDGDAIADFQPGDPTEGRIQYYGHVDPEAIEVVDENTVAVGLAVGVTDASTICPGCGVAIGSPEHMPAARSRGTPIPVRHISGKTRSLASALDKPRDDGERSSVITPFGAGRFHRTF